MTGNINNNTHNDNTIRGSKAIVGPRNNISKDGGSNSPTKIGKMYVAGSNRPINDSGSSATHVVARSPPANKRST